MVKTSLTAFFWKNIQKNLIFAKNNNKIAFLSIRSPVLIS